MILSPALHQLFVLTTAAHPGGGSPGRRLPFLSVRQHSHPSVSPRNKWDLYDKHAHVFDHAPDPPPLPPRARCRNLANFPQH